MIRNDDRGAAAITIALLMVLFMGIAAIAIDLGLGFNERRVDQTAGDTGVMAGAVGFLLAESPQAVTAEVLNYARDNLPSEYTDGEWEQMWRDCQDPDRIAFDVGTGTPVTFQPMPVPAAWGSGTLDCVSSGSSYLRVRVPDQITDTTFARVIGVQEITTSAAAVARIQPGTPHGAIIPFGIPFGTPAGEMCLKSSGSGNAYEPCEGPDAGGFGTINSPFFGDFLDSSPLCGNPGHPEQAQNIALGLDHFVSQWSPADAAAQGVTPGSGHPGPGLASYLNINYDSCRIQDGAVVPRQSGHSFPPNTVNVDTGYSPSSVEEGLITGTLLGEPALLRQGTNPKRTIESQSNTYSVDNRGLWTYLTGNLGDECDPSTYSGLPTFDEDPEADSKVKRIHTCLFSTYPSYGSSPVIFSASIANSPRFAWAPEFWMELGTGNHWQPVYQFRMIYIGGMNFNCSTTECGAIFYPDQDDDEPICDPAGPTSCKNLNLHQVTGWLLPSSAVPDEVTQNFPGGAPPFEPTLFK
jgi:hypothetical protein